MRSLKQLWGLGRVSCEVEVGENHRARGALWRFEGGEEMCLPGFMKGVM